MGRWSSQGSDSYVRTYRGVVRRLLQMVAERIASEDAYHVFDEAEAIEVLQESAAKKLPESKDVLVLEASDAKSRSSACLADLRPVAQVGKKGETFSDKLDVQAPETESEVEAEAKYIIAEDRNRGALVPPCGRRVLQGQASELRQLRADLRARASSGHVRCRLSRVVAGWPGVAGRR